ncbi:hypothetical protein OIV83_003630 [Microbotryomycetes sp. JL201]|nr:hypothetical protein OIV83_003630 [Microbotryomycetes sp. JL201]
MPPKRPRQATSAQISHPNTNHPSAAELASALQRGRPHSLAYHAFLKSTHTPLHRSETSKKKQNTATGLEQPVDDAIDAVVVQRKLLAWYDTVKTTRGMPWRIDVDPEALSDEQRSQRAYEVWVSEIMLQQTQVATVIDYWNRWMQKLPTIASLANADPELVNEIWKGLGYYSRATRLQKGAQKVLRHFKGFVPPSPQELLEIDGIGPYSAGAISSIAFAQRAAMVDGNIQRVLSRLTALYAPIASKQTTNFIWTLADVLVPDQKQDTLNDVGGLNKPGAWNQALMELGATVCTPKNPSCHACPLSEECLAYAEVRLATHERSVSKSPTVLPDIEECSICSPMDDLDRAEHSVTVYPMAKERKKPREEETAVCVLEWIKSSSDNIVQQSEKKILLVKRPEKGLLAGLYEFPAVDIQSSDELSTAKERYRLLGKLLSTLLAAKIKLEPGFNSNSSSDNDDIRSNNLAIGSIQELDPVKQIYSHQIRTYFATRVVIESNELPNLASAKNGTEYGVGRCKWVDEKDVASANTGGAVGKIWDERERHRKGLPSSVSTSKKAGSAKKQPLTVNNGSTLDGWMMRGSAKTAPKRKAPSPVKKKRRITKDGYKTGSSEHVDGDDDVVVVDDDVQDDFVPSAKYKKRVIAASSDEDDSR